MGGNPPDLRFLRPRARGVVAIAPSTRHVVALAVAIAAVLLRLALDPAWGTRYPYITFFPAIMFSAWLGGLWPGLVTTAITAAAAEYFWVGPGRSWSVGDPSELLGLTVFVAVGALISVLNEAWRRQTIALAESEERLGVTLASIGDAVVAVDAEGQLTRVNAVAEALTGWTEAEAIGRSITGVVTLVDERSGEPTENPVHRLLRGESIAELPAHSLLLSRNRRQIPIDGSASPIRTRDGRIIGAVLVLRDVSELRRVERERAASLDAERAARRESEAAAQQLQAAMQAGRMGTWQYDVATGLVKWSPALEAIHGFAPGTFPGTFDAFRAEIHPEDRDRVLASVAAALSERRDHHVEYRIVRRDGTERWVEGVGQVLHDERGRPERIVGVCADITERKEAEAREIAGRRQIEEQRTSLLEREQAARAEIERASRLKDEFLAVISHELRTPLNAVLGYAQLLHEGALPPERSAHALEAIRRNAQAQARLVHSLLDLSRIVAGKLELDVRRIDLGSVAQAAIDAVRPQADAGGVRLETDMPPAAITLDGDAARLQQVFWNLLSNAIKFTPRGGRVRMRLAERDSHAHVEIADTGIGIAPGFLPLVFDRFSQADGQKGRAGLGLGLALVREMVQAHGGTVTAASAGEGLGSTFSVSLPVSLRAPHSTLEPADRIDAAASGRALPGLDILVIDDQLDVRELLELVLTSRGAGVRTAGSAAEGLEAIGRKRPDVLLADLRMPGEDGYSLIGKLRARERERRCERIPAIAVTADASAGDRERALASGYDWHLAKPVDPDELVSAVAAVTGAKA
jgi:PAS domain S-box-containing protein